MIPTTLSREQLKEPYCCLSQSLRLASKPPHWTLEYTIAPIPSPK